MLTDEKYEYYIQVLKEELVPAMGCTEPISIAYASAKAKQTLGSFPKKIKITVSGNIIKNAKSVVVPHTGGMRGIKAAAIAGIVAGNPDVKLQVLSNVTTDEICKMKEVMSNLHCKVELAETPLAFYIEVVLENGKDTAKVIIANRHTNIILIKKNGKTLFEGKTGETKQTVKRALSCEEIVDFADNVKIEDIHSILERQIKYNMAIANEGLKNDYGANVGKVYLASYANEVSTKAKAYASAGSDARMNGCEMPVIINSGSGNQGMATSIPVIIYAEEMGVSEEMLYRALCVSNLLTIHIKHGIGTLSAYCGAVVAGACAGAGIAYLHGGKFRDIAHTVVNALAIDSGLVCDGAKASCAAKIATAVENGILGFNMWKHGQQFYGGDGIVTKGIENTIDNVSRLATLGMKETDKEILNIMMRK